MAPTPQKSMDEQETGAGIEANIPPRERVVISGISGLYPKSRHVKDLADILYNKINPVTTDSSRWVFNHPEMTGFTGKVPGLNNFDAQFFKVHYLLARYMDVISRKALEQTHMAIYDAGLNPEQLNGKKIGVYLGASMTETEKVGPYIVKSSFKNAFILMGSSRAMFANRISYWLNAKGPSLTLDQACCSSAQALELAHKAILRGECEAAIVVGCYLCLHPQSTIHLGRYLKYSKDGKTSSFDEKADGSAQSEAVNVLFLQKAKDALRIYAEVVNVKSVLSLPVENDTKPRHCLYRNPTIMTEFLKEFYKESNVPPQAVAYIEGCGAAIPETDKAELEAYEKVFCDNRSSPLFVGSVMSNLGYVSAASGIAAITKIILGYHTGVLAGNLHCETPRRDLETLRDGRMVIVNDHMPFDYGYSAVNGVSITGVNSHVLLKGHYKPKDLTRYKSSIPHLVLVSGRQESTVTKILKDLKSRPVDPEEIALINNANATKMSGYLGRGFIILDTNKDNKTVSLSEKVDYLDYVKRPVWFVYSGMGSQYNGMGIHLMRIPVFAAAIERCHRVLQPKGIDIVDIITSSDKTIYKNILHSFVGIAAIQIGLTDILTELGIVPDKMIGHSVGELGCAYADGCMTAEEMILSAYSRGLVSVQTPFIRGSMAAIGIGHQKILEMCPPEIEVACHNSAESCTISGPVAIMQEFVASLVDKDIFAREVPCSNIAYHSRYIADAGPGLFKYLSEVLKTPKLRSERWVSTSVPMDKWDETSAKYSSAEYHTNNLLNPVLFEETSSLIPPDAILIEIAPHGLLQSILKRALPASCSNIPLTRRGHDNAIFMLEAVGKLYVQGLDPKIQSLYPKIEFPVSTGTPMLSHFVEWAYDEKWPIPLYSSATKRTASATKNVISLHVEEQKYLRGHVIGGKILYPFAATLVAVWDTLAMTLGVARRQLPVQFRDVHLHVQPILHDRRELCLSVSLHRGSGRFEVMDEMDSQVASGYINEDKSISKILHKLDDSQSPYVTSNEIYDQFLSRGFAYKDSFKSIHNTNLSLTEARIQWCGNWVTFIDGIFQFNNLRHSHELYSHPNFISKLIINPDEQDKHDATLMTAVVEDYHNVTKCGGVLMENITFCDVPVSIESSMMLRGLMFIPHFASNKFYFETIVQVYFQIVAENVDTQSISVLGIYNNQQTLSKFNEIKRITQDVPEVTTMYTWFKRDSIGKEQKSTFAKTNLILICDVANDDYVYEILNKHLEYNTFILNIRDSVNNLTNNSRPSSLYQVVCDHSTDSLTAVELARWRPTNNTDFTSVVSVYSPSDVSLFFNERNSLLSNQNVLVITSYPAVPELKDALNEFKKQSHCKIRLVMNNNNDKLSDAFEAFDDDSLVNNDMAVRIIKNGVIGGEYYVPVHHDSNDKINVSLQSIRDGKIESLKWVQSTTQPNRGISVKVHYAAVNDIDSKRFTGLIPCNTTSREYGMDFSGITQSGTRVMGLIECGAVSTLVEAHPEFLWPVPAHWSLEDAATVPFAYCLAYYCLAVKYCLVPGSRILIHGGAGALGQAIISLALAYNCEVFVTVGDVRKKQFLLKLYPELKAENIGNSRDISFCDLVLNATNGKGVDVVIATVMGNVKTVSQKCVGFSGILIDISQIPNREYFEYGMYNMTKSRSYVAIDFLSVFNDKGNTMKTLQRMISDGIVRGWVRPLSRIVYAPKDVSRALQLLAGSKQRGRVLLQLQKTDIDALCVQPRLQCSAEKLHIIINDHESFGKELTDMLIRRGARKIYLRLPVSPEDFKLNLRHWQNQGVEITCEYTGMLEFPKCIFDNCAISSDSIEGIYILITRKQRSMLDTTKFLKTIDAMTRKKFPDLKYFAVINTINSIGEETCIARKKEQFAATMLKLPELKEIVDYKPGQMSVSKAVETVERAITSMETILSAHVETSLSSSLLHQFAVVAGINIVQDNIKGTTTLSDLGTDEAKAKILSAYLRNTYNIFFTANQIQGLTMERIEFIDTTLSRTSFDNEKGLPKLFTCVDKDEIVATTDIVFMSTLTRAVTVRDNEFDVSVPYLCIIPGLEGHYGRFRKLCELLKLPALVLQPNIGHPYETIPEMARRFAKILSQTASPNKHFYLIGYEIGVFVVLEMAAILEDNGFTIQVYCIGNPNEIKTEIKEHLKGLETKETLQDAIVRHMFRMMTNNETDELELALQGVASWEEKLNITMQISLGKVSHSAQYARQVIVAAYGRILSLLKYDMKIRALRSQLILLQPKTTAGIQQSDLQRFSLRPVICHELQAPLAEAAEDLRCAAIVNAHLDINILEEFENKNLCESYVQDSTEILMYTTELD